MADPQHFAFGFVVGMWVVASGGVASGGCYRYDPLMGALLLVGALGVTVIAWYYG